MVDEAHRAGPSTEFGKFAHWLQADYLLMATATPRISGWLTDCLAHAPATADRALPRSAGDDVVKARLNKQYIEAVVCSPGHHHAAGDRLAAHGAAPGLGTQCADRQTALLKLASPASPLLAFHRLPMASAPWTRPLKN